MQSSSASVSKSVLRRRGIKIKVRCRSARQEPWWSCAAHRLVRPGNRLQGDLFQDSAKTIALDAVNRALAEHRFDAGRSALERLSELPDTHVLVNDYLRLMRAAERCSTEPAERLRELEEDVAPLAASTLVVSQPMPLLPPVTSTVRPL